MPTFETPEPITATIDVTVGDVRISAGDRSDTVVDVRPSDASNDEDVKRRRARPASSSRAGSCGSRHPSCGRGRSGAPAGRST